MERSSPLAAMQPSTCMAGPWAFQSNVLGSRHPFSGAGSFGANSFNFRDLSMKKSSSDYFTVKPAVRGSSPTASLAADLSQNFHIDKSPQLPTPRRSLFTTNLLGAIDIREGLTTPPLPSSSPGPANDSMDISPLPHKAPFAAAASQTRPELALRAASDELPVIPSSPTSLPTLPDEGLRSYALLERKKPAFLRPSLARTKGYSTSTLSLASNAPESQLPPFKFSTGSKLSDVASVSLGECFSESPPQERRSASLSGSTITLMGPPRPKQPFLGMSARNGSPVGGHVRKQPCPAARPRKQFRRSLSMFEHPGDVMKQEKKDLGPSAGLQSIMDVDDSHMLQLPHFIPEDKPDSLPRISKDTLIDVLDGRYRSTFGESCIVDCRFEYEYHGGHIDGAINFNDKELLAQKLFEPKAPGKTLLIFHCEYSAHRAPIMAKFIRGQDRAVNDFRYPKLTYPEIYILDGGYSSFFADHRARCFPQNYVEMEAKEHANACEREMGRLRQRTKLSRAQTFAFGQHGLQSDDSPTGPGKFCDDQMMGMDLSDPQSEQPRAHARRMASY
ncbi:MAG: cell division cycle- protein [Thelocarpon impressellum]|nr:MAG: cell division cycle- protein [Thelocarpon impressellum]